MQICSTSIALFLLAPWIALWSQPRRQCATMEHHQQILREHPEVRQNLQDIERFTRMRAKVGRPRETVIRIPVAVHILYNTPEQNISDRQITSQIEALNRDFQRKNNDAKFTDPIFEHLAADIDVEFVLANQDPQGNPTPGITRTYTDKKSFIAFTDEVKKAYYGGKDAWPASSYLNIWVCNLDMGVLGFAQFPGSPPETDGVVIGYKYFGTTDNVSPPFNMGRTTTHEVGHWLNLRHVWGDSPCGDDGVADTPPSESPHHGCVQADSSCGSPDMVQNFMDYTDDACMNLFTKGQRQRMRSLFDPGGPREAILYSKGYNPDLQPVCEVPSALSAQNITLSRAKLHWDPVSRSKGYQVRMRRLPDGEWKTWRTPDNDVNAYQLWSCTYYEFQVQSYCGFDNSTYSEIISFKTTGCTDGVVQGIQVIDVNAYEARISWSKVQNAQGYQFEYVRDGNEQIQSRTVVDNTIFISSLLPNQRYFFRIRAIIADKLTPFSKAESFVTSTSGRSDGAQPELFITYPKPATDFIKLELLEDPQSKVTMMIRNESDEVIYRKADLSLVPNRPYTLKMSSLPRGNYQIILKLENGFEFYEGITLVDVSNRMSTARGAKP